MRTTTIATVATVVLALLIVAKTRTVGLTEATGNPRSEHNVDLRS